MKSAESRTEAHPEIACAKYNSCLWYYMSRFALNLWLNNSDSMVTKAYAETIGEQLKNLCIVLLASVEEQ